MELEFETLFFKESVGLPFLEALTAPFQRRPFDAVLKVWIELCDFAEKPKLTGDEVAGRPFLESPVKSVVFRQVLVRQTDWIMEDGFRRFLLPQERQNIVLGLHFFLPVRPVVIALSVEVDRLHLDVPEGQLAEPECRIPAASE